MRYFAKATKTAVIRNGRVIPAGVAFGIRPEEASAMDARGFHVWKEDEPDVPAARVTAEAQAAFVSPSEVTTPEQAVTVAKQFVAASTEALSAEAIPAGPATTVKGAEQEQAAAKTVQGNTPVKAKAKKA